MTASKIPLLFVRYAPGSAGNFLISILQTSNKLPCWDMQVENSKGTPQFEDCFKNWFSKCFQSNLEEHGFIKLDTLNYLAKTITSGYLKKITQIIWSPNIKKYNFIILTAFKCQNLHF